MSIDTQKFTTTDVISIPFGMRLKSAREARGLEGKDVAAQLRLSEKMISMIEKETYPADLPVTFVRGYIRAYARLMEISDSEITNALEPIKPLVITEGTEQDLIEAEPVTSSNYFMQFFTYLILFTIIGLVGVWWYAHPSSDNHNITTTEVPLNQNTQPPNTPTQDGPPNASSNTAAPSITVPPPTSSLETPTLPRNATPILSAQDKSSINENALDQHADSMDLVSEKPDAFLAIQMITGEYPIQFLTHLILFLLISFIMLWWQQYITFISSSVASNRDPLAVLPNQFNSSLNLELATETEVPVHTVLLSPSELRHKREIKKTMRILTSLVLFSLLGLLCMWWYNYTESATHAEMFSTANQESITAEKPVTTQIEKTSTPLIPATSVIKTDNVKSSETNTEANQHTTVPAQVKTTNQTASVSSGKYTPVPVVKKITSKHKRKAVIPTPVVDEFSELDDNQ